jgi:hypothetical protein
MKFGTGIYNNISSANLILIHTGAMKQKSNFIDLKRGGGYCTNIETRQNANL